MIYATRKIKAMDERCLSSKNREEKGMDIITMFCTAVATKEAVVWCCSGARDDGDDAAAKIAGATPHVLRP
jgi:hypothetical protein